MFNLIAEGGFFMWPLTAFGLIVIGLTLKKLADVSGEAEEPASQHRPMINVILQVGIFSVFLGILSQAVGLLQALQSIEMSGTVSPAMLAGGIKVSLIAPIYGVLIFLVSFAAWSFLNYRAEASVAG